MMRLPKSMVVLVVAAAATLVAVTVVVAFNPVPEPPAFGIVSVTAGQTIRLNAVCYQHEVRGVPPGPCRGVLMFHDVAGNDVAVARMDLAPGQATFLDFTPPRTIGSPVGINPCFIPGPDSGRVLPTVEVIDTATGATALFVNPDTPRITFIKVDAPGGGR